MRRSRLALVLVVLAPSLSLLGQGNAEARAALPASPILTASGGEYALLFPQTGRVAPLGFSGQGATFSPDGASIAYGVENAANMTTQIRVRSETGADRPVVVAAGWAIEIEWSPDGTRLAYTTTSGDETVTDTIRVISIASGTSAQVYSWTHGRYDGGLNLAWRPGTERVFFTRSGVNIYSVSAAGGAPTRHTDICDPIDGGCQFFTTGYGQPQWNNDGSRLAAAYENESSEGIDSDYVLWTPDNPGSRVKVADIPASTSGTVYFRRPVWSPDAASLAIYRRPGSTAGSTDVLPVAGGESLYTTALPALDWQPCSTRCPDFTDNTPPVKTATTTAVKLTRRATLSATVTVRPGAARGTAKVVLQSQVNGAWKTRGTKAGRLNARATYVAKFARPKQRKCRFQVKYSGSPTHKPSSKTLNFRC